MSCFEKEGSWSLSFAGAGFLGLYHVGVTHCLRQRAPRLLRGARRFYGSSSGALVAVSVVSGLSVGESGGRLRGPGAQGASACLPESTLIPTREGGLGEGCLKEPGAVPCAPHSQPVPT